MNVFRLVGDLSHLAAIIILLLKIWKTRSCAGISGESQKAYCNRYHPYANRYLRAWVDVMCEGNSILLLFVNDALLLSEFLASPFP